MTEDNDPKTPFGLPEVLAALLILAALVGFVLMSIDGGRTFGN